MRNVIFGIAMILIAIGGEASMQGITTQHVSIQSVEVRFDGLLKPSK